MNIHALFCHSWGEQHRTFNGSIAYYKVWDQYMTEDEINAEIGAGAQDEINADIGAGAGGGGTAVDPADKVTTTWADVKTQ
jgi:hypothetical protein